MSSSVLPKYNVLPQTMPRIYEDGVHVGWHIAVTMERDGRTVTHGVDVKPANGVEPYKVEGPGGVLEVFSALVNETVAEHDLILKCNQDLDG